MMRKRYNLWQRIVMALRDVNRMATCNMQCPGCDKTVNGDERSWWCPNCGGAGSSG